MREDAVSEQPDRQISGFRLGFGATLGIIAALLLVAFMVFILLTGGFLAMVARIARNEEPPPQRLPPLLKSVTTQATDKPGLSVPPLQPASQPDGPCRHAVGESIEWECAVAVAYQRSPTGRRIWLAHGKDLVVCVWDLPPPRWVMRLVQGNTVIVRGDIADAAVDGGNCDYIVEGAALKLK